ncbi:hypothetical protein RSSM_01093 [Rhodopirellula sallentina SM41]|uniref:Uncharacterized protein n=1 Tax=Rhodopirellula sallentina SM41 TaxID=1263870 RepID=M5UN91_9BACT|nr:hypothetical protein RSSM_01093 [Rhodopirellula sallentina SM41]
MCGNGQEKDWVLDSRVSLLKIAKTAISTQNTANRGVGYSGRAVSESHRSSLFSRRPASRHGTKYRCRGVSAGLPKLSMTKIWRRNRKIS